MAKAQTKQVSEEVVKKSREVVVTDQLRADYEAFAGQSKSATIRGLNAKGYTRGQIAKVMGIIYQHVRNVLITPVKRPATKAETSAE